MKLEMEIPEQDSKAGGWTVDFEFISKIRGKATEITTGESDVIRIIGMEETEAVILALLDVVNETKNT